ncbi:MAG: outer membrane protein assembly factor BamD [Bryobacteraceae bacterium]
MKLHRNLFAYGVVAIVTAGLMSSCAYRAKKYENPITKSTEQPDKVLFDKAVRDIEHGRYEVARLTLNTLMNTYDQSEYLAKAKLAIADSWNREGGAHGYAQAEAEYKDFILFYPNMEEAPEAQEKVCEIQLRQMDKADRDSTHTVRAEQECRNVLTNFPNSKFAPQVQQLLRNIQEVLAQEEYGVGSFYFGKGLYVSAASRLQGLTDHFPLFSHVDEALWKLGESYMKLPPKFRDKAAAAYSKLVSEYPLSSWVGDAKRRLKEMERPIPEPDPVALARQKYEMENHTKPGFMSHFWGVFRKGPDMHAAAKSGEPATESLRAQVPVSVPVTAGSGEAGADVTASPITGPSALDTQPDARPAQQAKPGTQGQTPPATAPPAAPPPAGSDTKKRGP